MKLASFSADGRVRVGVVDGDTLVDLGAAAPELPADMSLFLAAGSEALALARAAAAGSGARLGLADIALEATVPRPSKFFAVGLNYADHIAETGRPQPEFPAIFNKQVNCVNRTGGDIHLPRASKALDYEGELAFVIGRRCRHVSRADAPQVIAGYTIVNDVSVRDWQMRSPTFILGKGWDTHGPMGPWLVTPDEVGDPHTLELETWVNDERRQHSNTSELIFDCFTLVETLSTAFTLEPGDVVSTGTPSGVGVAMEPRRFLEAGDTVRIRIDRLGELVNRIVPEPDDTVRID